MVCGVCRYQNRLDASFCPDRHRYVPVARAASGLGKDTVHVLGALSASAAWSRARADQRMSSVASAAGQPGDIGQPHQRFDAGGASDGDGEAVDLGLGHLPPERRERLLDPLDGPALPQRQLRSLDGVGFEREPQHRALLRLGVDDHAREGVDDEIEPRRHVVGCVLGQQRVGAGLRVGGGQQGALVREVPVGGGAGDRCRLRGRLHGGRHAGRDELAGRGDEGLAGAPLLGDAAVRLVRD